MIRLDVYWYFGHVHERPITAGLLWHHVLAYRASRYLNRLTQLLLKTGGSYLEKHSDRVSIQVGLPPLRENI